jgi:hypothetical protein
MASKSRASPLDSSQAGVDGGQEGMGEGLDVVPFFDLLASRNYDQAEKQLRASAFKVNADGQISEHASPRADEYVNSGGWDQGKVSLLYVAEFASVSYCGASVGSQVDAGGQSRVDNNIKLCLGDVSQVPCKVASHKSGSATQDRAVAAGLYVLAPKRGDKPSLVFLEPHLNLDHPMSANRAKALCDSESEPRFSRGQWAFIFAETTRFKEARSVEGLKSAGVPSSLENIRKLARELEQKDTKAPSGDKTGTSNPLRVDTGHGAHPLKAPPDVKTETDGVSELRATLVRWGQHTEGRLNSLSVENKRLEAEGKEQREIIEHLLNRAIQPAVPVAKANPPSLLDRREVMEIRESLRDQSRIGGELTERMTELEERRDGGATDAMRIMQTDLGHLKEQVRSADVSFETSTNPAWHFGSVGDLRRYFNEQVARFQKYQLGAFVNADDYGESNLVWPGDSGTPISQDVLLRMMWEQQKNGRQRGPKGLDWSVFVDAFGLMHAMETQAVAHAESQTEEHSSSRNNYAHTHQARMASSYQTVFPEVFGPAGDLGEGFGARMATYKKWNSGDGQGVRHRLVAGAEATVKIVQHLVQAHIPDPMLAQLATTMLAKSKDFVVTLVTFVDEFYHEMCQSGMDDGQAWQLTCLMLLEMFSEMNKERTQVKAVMKSDRIFHVWGMLKTHTIMERLRDNKFRDDPSMTGILLRFIVKQRGGADNVTVINRKMNALETKLSAAERAFKTTGVTKGEMVTALAKKKDS